MLILSAIFLSLSGSSQESFSFSDSAILSRLKKDVYILASDSMQGRRSGTQGEKLAVEYIISGFREAGLEPGGVHPTSYIQPFPSIRTSIPANRNTFDIKEWPGNNIKPGSFTPTAYSANGHVTTNKYSLIDLAKFNKQHSVPLREAIRLAFKGGDSVIILMNGWLLKGKEANILYARAKMTPESGPVISVNDEIADFLLSHPGTQLDINVEIIRDTSWFHNVVGKIDNHAKKTILIGAHFDHNGISRKGKVMNGADDNASGTALMMEMARYLKVHGNRGVNYLFIAFSGEEEGLLGSQYYAGHPTLPMEDILFAVNFDMVGRLGCEGNRIEVIGTGSSPEWRHLYKNVPHPEFRIKKIRGIHAFSDHYSLYAKNVPVISVTTGFHYEYHTHRDDADWINYQGMADLAVYMEKLTGAASTKGEIRFRPSSGWSNFLANLNVIIHGIDHVLTVGMEE